MVERVLMAEEERERDYNSFMLSHKKWHVLMCQWEGERERGGERMAEIIQSDDSYDVLEQKKSSWTEKQKTKTKKGEGKKKDDSYDGIPWFQHAAATKFHFLIITVLIHICITKGITICGVTTFFQKYVYGLLTIKGKRGDKGNFKGT